MKRVSPTITFGELVEKLRAQGIRDDDRLLSIDLDFGYEQGKIAVQRMHGTNEADCYGEAPPDVSAIVTIYHSDEGDLWT